MAEKLRPCPFCGGEAKEFTGEDAAPHRWTVECDSCGAHVGSDTRHKARAKWNRRAERTWHDFSDELPPVGVSVLCKGKNGAYYVGKPVKFRGERTGKVWVPRGAEYRSPTAWRPVDFPPCDRYALLALADECDSVHMHKVARRIREACGEVVE